MDPRIPRLRATLREPFAALIDPEGDPKRRLLVAAAALPMPPDVLLPALVTLAYDTDDTVRERALATLHEQPVELLGPMLLTFSNVDLLGLFGELVLRLGHDELTVAALTNPATPDETVSIIARRASASLTERIGQNQVRLIRCPDIIKSLYFNEQTPMTVVMRIIETAVRNDVDLSHLPGADKIKVSILGGPEPVVAPPEGEPGEPPVPPGDEAASDALQPALLEDAPSPGGAGPDAAAIGDDEFMRLLAEAASDEGVFTAATVTEGESEDPERLRPEKSIWNLVRTMSVAQKVRLALIGNMAARSVLIRDSKKLVALSVLDSPRLTDREVADFARNKSLSDDVVRRIAYNRDWTRNLQIQKTLIANPKCPPSKGLEFVKNQTIRDLKEISHDREVPAFIVRTAKALLAQREKRQGGGR